MFEEQPVEVKMYKVLRTNTESVVIYESIIDTLERAVYAFNEEETEEGVTVELVRCGEHEERIPWTSSEVPEGLTMDDNGWITK